MGPDSIRIPHIKTVQDNLFFELEKKIVQNQVEVESWFRSQWLKHPPLITCSVDLRNAGYKLAPVDTNVFPAGFNNLNPEFLPLCIQAAAATITQVLSTCKNILIVPESHTRNIHYFESLKTLENILTQAGYHVRIGTLRDIEKAENFQVGDDLLTQWPISKKEGVLHVDGFKPCLIILNNDLTEGLPEQLKNIEQPILPNPLLGWHQRSKFRHFIEYDKIAKQMAELLNIDPWVLSPLFTECSGIDFDNPNQLELNEKAEILFSKIEEKYKAFGIQQDPFIVIKSDTGTYGMAVLMIKNPNQLKNMNRKQRNKMSVGKGGKAVDHVLLQEGVYTMEAMGPQQATAEPVVYMIGQYVIGGFYRVHTGKGMQDNLNSPGMHFEPLAFEACCNTPDEHLVPHDAKNQFYAYSVIARMAHLATVFEMEP